MTRNQKFYLQILFSSQQNVGTFYVGFKFLTGLDDAFARFDLGHTVQNGVKNYLKSHLNLDSLFISLQVYSLDNKKIEFCEKAFESSNATSEIVSSHCVPATSAWLGENMFNLQSLIAFLTYFARCVGM